MRHARRAGRWVAGTGDLVEDVLHVPRSEELTLLDVDRATGLGSSDQQVRLAAEEGRDLQDIDGWSHGGALLFRVNVGQDRNAEFLLDVGEDFHRLFQPDAALGRKRGAVRLVEGRLVDEAKAKFAAELDELAGDHEGVVTAFHLAGAGDQGKSALLGENGLGRTFADDDFRIGGNAHFNSSKAKVTPCPFSGATTRRAPIL